MTTISRESWTEPGAGTKLPSSSHLRIPQGMESPPEQRARALVAVLQRAAGRSDLLELADMLGLAPELQRLTTNRPVTP